MTGSKTYGSADDAGRRELLPTGTLRAGVVAAPAPSALFVTLDEASGIYKGVTVDLVTELARQLGSPLAITGFANSGDCTQALEDGRIDVSFMPVDAERSTRVAFGPAYYILESTYLVSHASGIVDLTGVDDDRVRVVGIANTTTIRSAARTLCHTAPVAVSTIAEAVERLRSGNADALALSRDAFQTLLPLLPGARVLDGGFQATGIAIAVGREKPMALSIVSEFMEKAKRSGLVRRALDSAGFANEPVAPAVVTP
ncbi:MULTISPECIES: transporter substrate-binding domain-containing protein [Rhizobium]|uniref:Transporter substrate-binding domain-containing protein n=1 Tax=Rhizobium rhododendri TaxID=2506430 RepID=A0ABY8IH40_9HYPH|nr:MULTISPECIES: transporter substrate-binding domain-containing protein [Rhizobium]MBZ5762186.1 transporter substrate-binding domain-containing protein [Rhizobium sp. VS19-DR96]MBZ5767649.1 transporter substrate-binding domain-containing protein [Rhizobium sp. VS19-DR129.2]MBZ5775444.1 transporter substrate-binding domain-containing protein [Rhizobium sp. VS19-DRK62.2]MBZ5786133.1 transporter substrate-binding domain-containing protein [Rhizobium sp. VS19-DR121]MBZ5803745.1 transporter substr